MRKRRADPTSVRFRRLRVRLTVAAGTPKFSLDNALDPLAGNNTEDLTQKRKDAERMGSINPGFVEVLVREMVLSLFDSPRLCKSFFEPEPQKIWLFPPRSSSEAEHHPTDTHGSPRWALRLGNCNPPRRSPLGYV